ncbi:MAG TPA: response regulator transcription factor [Nitrospiria bacterium]|nr:response regulator transcription factor [Nitrospiria bacterium]
MKTALVVEDEPDIVRLLSHYLAQAGYRVRTESDGLSGLSAAREDVPAVIILDVMLPGLDGYEVCRRLRSDAATAAVPILMLTARGAETDKVRGLEIGADDYVTKPFSPKEVVARVKALVRRSGGEAAGSRLSYGDLTLDTERHEVSVHGREVSLTAKEFALLEYLLRRRGKLATREALLNSVWGYDADVTTRTVDVHIRRLREKIPSLTTAIQTVKPYGYKLAETPADAADA